MDFAKVHLVLALFCLTFAATFVKADDDAKIHCTSDHKLVLSKTIAEVQQNCTAELPDDHKDHCKILCMMEKLGAIDKDGHPDKTKFMGLACLIFKDDLCAKVKKLTCFDDHASKIEKSDDKLKVCKSAADFDKCISTGMIDACKA